ncbi:Basic membrane lipoprotein Med, substrate-binding protein (PBP1-ABC) superfamily [Enhydrobacter aerosaccus]|uniref:Basic membrane lipoprotein Med, substrate-binding protein (PBP1-ABC) superfamily n=1 Tax=Enhydrobacter aerosaccus TaxID=225324 RepID=A0A1T4PQ07_9HYPH|nr:Basic membrane lipoprotein Med, substrate-binding protein (PBP1-ABC) superfamily [Enhydrobacter aerosaccus]
MGVFKAGRAIVAPRRAVLRAAAAMAVAGALPAWAQSVKGKLKVAGIYTVPVEQQWVGRIHTALKAAEARGDIDYVWAESIANTDYERVMRQYAEGGQQLVFGEVFGVERAARTVAKDYPKTAFVMGSSFKPQEPNFSVFDNYIQEPAYLTGMIAGGMTKSNIIGMVGGYPIPEVNRLMNAFMEGAKEVNPQVKFLVGFIGSWFDPPKAKEAAFAMIDRGADVMYAERFGVSDAAKERKVLAIGNVINTQPQYPDTVVASALWHMEPTVDRAIAAVKAGTYKAEDYGPYSRMEYKGSSLAPLGTFESKVPEALKEKVKAREQEILAGKFTVKVNDAEPKATM